jgi:hypothetical protein
MEFLVYNVCCVGVSASSVAELHQEILNPLMETVSHGYADLEDTQCNAFTTFCVYTCSILSH